MKNENDCPLCKHNAPTTIKYLYTEDGKQYWLGEETFNQIKKMLKENPGAKFFIKDIPND